jgi:osmoprotectant transport system substrate-binding protein
MIRHRRSWARRSLALLGPALLLAACVSGGSSPGSHATGPGGVGPSSAIRIASFNFPESEVLAEIYGQALREAGYSVKVFPGLGPRELIEPALARGLVDFVPEYAGSALQFLTLGRERPTSSVSGTHRALARALRSRGLEALDAAPAQDANAIVVTRATAKRYGLRSISDLGGIAQRMTFGGPPECPQREFCLRGLEHAYGLVFDEPFYGFDAGGPLTLQALRSGDVDVALLFSTDPSIEKYNLVVLSDDRGLQPAENVTPVIRSETASRYGHGLMRAVNEVSAGLTTEELRALNVRATAANASPPVIAAQWLADRGIE